MNEDLSWQAKFTFAEGWAGTWAQQAWGVDYRSAFLFLAVGPCPFYSDWLSLGAQPAPNWLMLHLEFRGGVGNNFGGKMELSEQESRTASS
jgi:hypothetical protein